MRSKKTLSNGKNTKDFSKVDKINLIQNFTTNYIFSPVWGIVDYINNKNKYYEIGIYIRGYNDIYYDPHGIYSPTTGKILDFLYSNKKFNRKFKHKILIDPDIHSKRSELISEPEYKYIKISKRGEIYKTKEEKNGILTIKMDNIKMNIEVGHSYITKSLALYKKLNHTAIVGEQLGDILIGSYCVINIKKPMKLLIQVGDNVKGGISPNPIGEFI